MINDISTLTHDLPNPFVPIIGFSRTICWCLLKNYKRFILHVMPLSSFKQFYALLAPRSSPPSWTLGWQAQPSYSFLSLYAVRKDCQSCAFSVTYHVGFSSGWYVSVMYILLNWGLLWTFHWANASSDQQQANIYVHGCCAAHVSVR